MQQVMWLTPEMLNFPGHYLHFRNFNVSDKGTVDMKPIFSKIP